MTASQPRRVLLVDDERDVRLALAQSLELADLDPVAAGSFVEAKDHLTRRFPGVVVTDMRMPGRDGFHLLDYVRGVDPDLPVIVLTGEADVPMAVRAVADGAFAFIEKPVAPADLVAHIRRALARRGAVLAERAAAAQTRATDAAARLLIGVSEAAETLRDRVRAAARARATVLITGEAGTGTPKVAEVIHLLSPVSDGPLVKRGAGALDPPGLAEALAEAEGGTLYLDEVGLLPPPAQARLAEALDAETQGMARVVAGSTRDLGEEVAAGRFSGDLYWRLDQVRVRIPSLRERPEDIPVLFRAYVAQACEQANLPEPEITETHLARLMAQDWPGNARALMNVAMRFALGLGEAVEPGAGRSLAEQMAEVEKTLLADALRRHGGRAAAAAEALQVPRKTFYDKLARHGLRPEDFRPGR